MKKTGLSGSTRRRRRAVQSNCFDILPAGKVAATQLLGGLLGRDPTARLCCMHSYHTEPASSSSSAFGEKLFSLGTWTELSGRGTAYCTFFSVGSLCTPGWSTQKPNPQRSASEQHHLVYWYLYLLQLGDHRGERARDTRPALHT